VARRHDTALFDQCQAVHNSGFLLGDSFNPCGEDGYFPDDANLGTDFGDLYPPRAHVYLDELTRYDLPTEMVGINFEIEE